MNLFKIGVSNWIFEFENKTVEIRTLYEENIIYTSDGKIKIILTDVTFKTDLLNLFRKGNAVKHITQSFWLKSANNIEDENEFTTYEYDNLKITDISYHVDCESVCGCKITLVG